METNKEPLLGQNSQDLPMPDSKGLGGAPPKYTAEQIEEIKTDFAEYIKNTDDPTVVGFTSSYEKYDIRKSYMSQRQEFSNLVNRAVEKQEAYLVRQGGAGKYNPTIAIFRLKQPQHGYSDKQQVENSGEQKIIIETRKYGTPPTGASSAQND